MSCLLELPYADVIACYLSLLQTTGGIDDDSKVHIVYLGPSLSRLCASCHVLMCLPNTKPEP
jgi:hypothetical protein